MPSDTRLIDDFEGALIAMDRNRARRIFMEGVERQGALSFMENLVGAALDRIGEAWEAGGLALSQVYMAGRICEELSESVLPARHPERLHDPSIALAIFEDRHMLGKKMVHAVLRNEGYAFSDWGHVDSRGALERLKAEPVEVLLLSCLMLSSALRIKELSRAIHAEGMSVKLVVGGAPFRFDPDLWTEVGADAMGRTASQVTGLIRDLEIRPAAAGGHS